MKLSDKQEVDKIIRVFAQRIYDIQFQDIPNATKNPCVDRDCRIISDYLGTEKLKVTHSTYFILKNCKMWSESAITLYKTLKGNHADRCSSKKQGGTMFIVEHEYPLGVVKKMVQEKKFKTPEAVVTYMKKYALPVIVTVDEDERLRVQQRTANSLKEADGRYARAKIKVKRFEDWAK